MKTLDWSLAFSAAFFVVLTIAPAAAPQTAAPMLINYQGKLRSPTTGDPVPDGDYDMVFRIYDVPSGGTALWTGTHETARNPVRLMKGIFSVVLGSGTGNALDPSIFEGADRWLEIQVGSETLSPRHRIDSTPYAFKSENSRLLDGKEKKDFAEKEHPHSGSDIKEGTVSKERIDEAITRDTEKEAAIAAHAAIADAHHTRYTDAEAVSAMGAKADSNPLNHDKTTSLPWGSITSIPAGFADGVDNDSGGTCWLLTGNTGTSGANFLGTGDNQALELRVNSARALRLEPNATSPNVIGGYSENAVTPGVYAATIAGGGVLGNPNRVTDSYGTVAGGGNNFAGNANGDTMDAFYATVGGGEFNTASAGYATVGGGLVNTADAIYATVGGGYYNSATEDYATISGGRWNIAPGPDATVAGGSGNSASGWEATVGGGGGNAASGTCATVGGGSDNRAVASYATIAGGGPSDPANPDTTRNLVTDDYGTIGGGGGNQAGDNAGTTDDASYATVGGGLENTASGLCATVGGGYDNTAAGDFSFAAGRGAKANHPGAFVWADSSGAEWSSERDNGFLVRANGGAGFFVNNGGWVEFWEYDNKLIRTSVGAYLTTGGVWTNSSDMEKKENFVPVNGREVLSRLAGVPITTWNCKAEDESIRHMGPVAQDFHAAFGLGEDDKHISTVDADGVALAAIQGLHEILEEKDAKISGLERKNTELERRLGALEELLKKLTCHQGDQQ